MAETISITDDDLELIRERSLSNMISNSIIQKKKSFAYAETQLWFCKLKYLDDSMLMLNSLLNWMSKLKKEDSDKRKLLNEIAFKILNIDTYAIEIEDLNRETVYEYLSIKKEIEDVKYSKLKAKLKSELKQKSLKSQIEQLEKEIEFTNRK